MKNSRILKTSEQSHFVLTQPSRSVVSFLKINLLFYLFTFGCFGSLLWGEGFLQLPRVGATLRCGARAAHCSDFSCCGTRALGTWASVFVAHGLSSCGLWALEHRFSSCGARAQLLRDMWDLPGPGLKPVSPALAGRFLTTVPLGKLSCIIFKEENRYIYFSCLEYVSNF